MFPFASAAITSAAASTWLADVAIKGLLLFAFAAIISAVLLICRMSASLRHFVWLLAVAASLALPCLSIVLPNWIIRLPSNTFANPEAESAPTIEGIGLAESTLGIAADSPASVGQPSEQATIAIDVGLDPMPTDQASSTASATTPPWRLIVGCVWLAGVILALIPTGIGLVRLWQWRQTSDSVAEWQSARLLEELRNRFHINRHIELLSTSKLIPMTWGLRRPVILLPVQAAHWPVDRLRAVLLHELAHVQRFDFVTQLLAQFARALYWYNPLAWLAVRRLRREQEQACDDRVLQAGFGAVDYADHLLAIASQHGGRISTPAVALAMARSSHIERRLFSILDSRRSRGGLRPIPAMIVVALASALLVPLASATLQASEQQDGSPVPYKKTNEAAQQPTDKQASQRQLADRLDRLRQALLEHYVTPPSDEQVVNGAIQGMLGSLADPYTEFLPAEKLAQLTFQIEGKLTGIGAHLDMRDGEVTVVTPLEGSPSLLAGLKPGDVIVEVDGKPTKELDLAQVIKRISGEGGTIVKLKLRRAGGNSAELAITRGPIVLRTVKGFRRGADGDWNYWLDGEHGVAYLVIDQFGAGTAREIRETIAGLQQENLQGLILDLRFTPGGLLSSAVEAAELLLPEATIVSLRGRESGEHVWKSDGKKQLGDFPLIVLINERTASAAEVLVGALQDNNRAVLLGSRTFGKGSVQTLIDLDDQGGAIRLTTALYYLPSGRNIDRKPGQPTWGIDPTDGFFVPLTTADAEAALQARLQRAILGGQSTDAKNTPGTLTPEHIAKDHHDPQLAGALQAMLSKFKTGDFEKVGRSADAAARYALSRGDVERRRATLLQNLKELDQELSAIEKQAVENR